MARTLPDDTAGQFESGRTSHEPLACSKPYANGHEEDPGLAYAYLSWLGLLVLKTPAAQPLCSLCPVLGPDILCSAVLGFSGSARFLTPSCSCLTCTHWQSELNEWLLNPPEGCNLESFEPVTSWVVHMQGPENSPAPGLPRLYDGELFR